jgi:hypothetical protein
MPIADWPSGLPYRVRRSGFAEIEPYRAAVTTEVEDGPDLMRGGAQTIVKKFAYRLRFNHAQFSTWRTFVETTLGQGIAHFTMQVPVDGVTYSSRRVYLDQGKWSRQPQGRDWSVSFTLCVFPPAE